VPIASKSGSLNLLEPSGSVQVCNGIALPYLHYLCLQSVMQKLKPQNAGTHVCVKVAGCEVPDCVRLAECGDKCRAFLNTVMNFGFNKRCDFLEYLAYW
jgi:hypothetical protein